MSAIHISLPVLILLSTQRSALLAVTGLLSVSIMPLSEILCDGPGGFVISMGQQWKSRHECDGTRPDMTLVVARMQRSNKQTIIPSDDVLVVEGMG